MTSFKLKLPIYDDLKSFLHKYLLKNLVTLKSPHRTSVSHHQSFHAVKRRGGGEKEKP